MSALQSGHLSPCWCTVSAHDSQKRWCPQGTRAIRGSLRLIRHTSQKSSDALVAGPDVTAASWLCLIGRLRLILVCVVVRHRSLLKDGHSTLRCGRPCFDSWRPRTASVYAFEHIFHKHLTSPAMSTPALSTFATWCRIVHSCNVHPCHIVLIDLSTPINSIPATWCRFVDCRKFSVP